MEIIIFLDEQRTGVAITMGVKDKLTSLLLMGVSIDYRCDDCGAEFEAKEPVCPECDSTSVTDLDDVPA